MRALLLALVGSLAACALPANLRSPELRSAGADAAPVPDVASSPDAPMEDAAASCAAPTILAPLQGALYASSAVAMRVRAEGASSIEVQRAAPPAFSTEPVSSVAVVSGVAESLLSYEGDERGRSRLLRVRARCANGASSSWVATVFRAGTRVNTASGAAWRADSIERFELDVNADGRTDLLAATSAASLGVSLGQATAGLAAVEGVEAAIEGAAAVGDVHGDGLGDAIVGQSARPDSAGSITVLRGSREGTMRAAGRFTIAGTTGLGRVVAAAGDVDGDGLSDVLAADAQRAFVLSGRALSDAAGAVIAPIATLAPSGLSAESIDAMVAGDFDGDGDFDVAIGVSALRAGAGSVFVFERQSSDYRAVAEHRGSAANARFGAALAAGAVLNDGAQQLVVGAAGGANAADPQGEVFVFARALSMQSPIAVASIAARDVVRADRFGSAVAVNGDGDRDGASEIAVLSPAKVTSSGRVGQLSLFEFEGAATVRRVSTLDPPSDVAGASFAGPLAACGTFTADNELCFVVAQPRERGFGGFAFARSINAAWMQTGASRTLSFSSDGAAARLIALRERAVRGRSFL